MQKNPRLAFLACASALLALSACGEPETITAEPVDPQAEALKNAPPVELPPSIQASRTYRCRDNSLVYADFYTNDTVRVRIDDRSKDPTVLTAEGGNPPYTGEGYSLSANADQVQFTAPGRGTQTCRTG